MMYKERLTEISLKGNNIISLFTSILALFMGFGVVAFFGGSSSFIQKGMGLTPSEVGLLVSIPTLTGGLLRIPFGAWSDSNGGKKSILILLMLSLLGLFIFSIIAFIYPDGNIPKKLYYLLLFCGALSGCGIGVFTAGIAHVSYWFKMSNQGTALGIYSGIGGISSGAITILISFGLIYFGFKYVYFIWFLSVLIGIIIFFIFDNDAWFFQLKRNGYNQNDAIIEAKKLGQEAFPKGNTKVSLITAAKNIKSWALSIIYFSAFGGSLALTSWLPFFWVSNYGFSIIKAGVVTGLLSMLSPITRIIGGRLSDIYRAEYINMIALSLCITGSLILYFSLSSSISIIGIGIMLSGIGLSNSSVFKLIPVYINGAVGGAAGIIGGIGAIGGFVIPPILGYVVNILGKNGYTKGFILYTFLFLLSFFIMVILNRSSRKVIS